MGYELVYAPCFVCDVPFGFNAHFVPSVKDDQGAKRPICEGCFHRVNDMREAKGVDRWPDPHPYEAQEVPY